jgi:hypothetical protein
MENKFKAGDKVVLVGTVGVAKPGATATVTSKAYYTLPTGTYVDIMWDRDNLSGAQADGGYHDRDFEFISSKGELILATVNLPSTEVYVDDDFGSFPEMVSWVKENFPNWTSLVITVVNK